MVIRRLLLTAVMSAVLLSGCSVGKTGGSLYKPASSDAEASAGSDSYYHRWQGEEISAETAAENGCLMLGDNGADISAWQGFLIDLSSSAQAAVTVCTESSVTLVAEDETGSSVMIRTKERNGDSVSIVEKRISPAEICCVRNEQDGCLEYYFGDSLIYAMPSEDGEGYSLIPAEFMSYSIFSGAPVTFPYGRCFASYSDFMTYYELYNDDLGLEELKADMESCDAEGGFNTHVVFLYGEMSAAGAQYEFLRAVKESGQLFIYLKRSVPLSVGAVSKWQLTCNIPSEYLSDVAPDAVTWVVYDETELG